MLRPPIQPFAHLVGAGIDVIDAGHTRQPVAQDGFADLKRAAQAREAGAGGATQIVRGPMVYRGGVAGLARGKQTVTAGSDMAQLAPMVDQVETRVGKVPEQWLVDGGFPAHEQIDAVAGKTELYAYPWCASTYKECRHGHNVVKCKLFVVK